MNTKHFLISSLFLAAICGGCVKPTIQGRNDPYVSNQVMFAGDNLRRDTAINAPNVTRDDRGELLFVTLPIRAATDKTLYVDYRATFFDSNRQVVSKTGWMTKTLQSNVSDQISVNSMGPRAVDFQIDLRYAQ